LDVVRYLIKTFWLQAGLRRHASPFLNKRKEGKVKTWEREIATSHFVLLASPRLVCTLMVLRAVNPRKKDLLTIHRIVTSLTGGCSDDRMVWEIAAAPRQVSFIPGVLQRESLSHAGPVLFPRRDARSLSGFKRDLTTGPISPGNRHRNFAAGDLRYFCHIVMGKAGAEQDAVNLHVFRKLPGDIQGFSLIFHHNRMKMIGACIN